MIISPLLTWEGYFGARTLRQHAARCPSSVGDRTPPVMTLALGAAPAVARVSGGVWLARCPGGCSGREMVSFVNPVFFCCECRNAEIDHLLRSVTLPEDKLRCQIEAYLCSRPVPATRNWCPEETIALLRAENKAHGVRIPAQSAC